jgi:hypothetical protein
MIATVVRIEQSHEEHVHPKDLTVGEYGVLVRFDDEPGLVGHPVVKCYDEILVDLTDPTLTWDCSDRATSRLASKQIHLRRLHPGERIVIEVCGKE